METQQTLNSQDKYLILFFDKKIEIYKSVKPNFTSNQKYYSQLLVDKYVQSCRWDDFLRSETELANWTNIRVVISGAYSRTKTFKTLEDLIKQLSSSRDKRKKYRYIVEFLMSEL